MPIQASPARLPNGDWGARVPAAARDALSPGAELTIRARSGKTWTAYASTIVRVYPDGNVVVSTARDRAAAVGEAGATPPPAPTPEAVAEAEGRRLLDLGDRLAVSMPYDAEALPLLRALPGARWDRETRRWTCSRDAADRARVLELAERLGLEIPAALRAIERPVYVERAMERAREGGAYPYQVTGVEHLASRERALLADDMGLGKTFQVLQALPPAANCLAVVVCPNSLKATWAAECRKWRPDLTPVVLRGRKSFRLPERGEVVIVNYDILPKDAPALRGCVLIADEAHRLKNRKAARTLKFRAMGETARQVWLLTGTPLLNRPTDLWGVLASGGMEREVFGGWKTFVRCFNGHKNRWGGYEWGDVEPEVPERLRRVMLRRMKSEVLRDLPGKVRSWIVVDVENGVRRALDDLWEEYGDVVGSGSLPPFERFSEIRAKLAEQRIPAMTAWVEDREDAGEPVLVFSAHRAPIDALGEREGWATITGSTSPDERQRIVEAFQAGELKGIGLTIQAGGVGLTLTRASSVLFVDCAWTPADNAQAEDRVCRIGQKANAINVVRMVADHDLDWHVQRLLLEKQALIDAAVEAQVSYTVPPTEEELSDDTFRAEWEAKVAEARAQAEKEAAEKERQAARGKVGGWYAGQEETPEDLEGWVADLGRAKVDALHAATEALAGVCDGAFHRDGHGYNKPDAGYGHWLASMGEWTPEAVYLAHTICHKYKRQLGDLWTEIYG